jgi:hypothetical protein
VSKPSESGVAILIGIDGNCVDSRVLSCTNNPNRNFSTVGNQHLRYRDHIESLGL